MKVLLSVFLITCAVVGGIFGILHFTDPPTDPLAAMGHEERAAFEARQKADRAALAGHMGKVVDQREARLEAERAAREAEREAREARRAAQSAQLQQGTYQVPKTQGVERFFLTDENTPPVGQPFFGPQHGTGGKGGTQYTVGKGGTQYTVGKGGTQYVTGGKGGWQAKVVIDGSQLYTVFSRERERRSYRRSYSRIYSSYAGYAEVLASLNRVSKSGVRYRRFEDGYVWATGTVLSGEGELEHDLSSIRRVSPKYVAGVLNPDLVRVKFPSGSELTYNRASPDWTDHLIVEMEGERVLRGFDLDIDEDRVAFVNFYNETFHGGGRPTSGNIMEIQRYAATAAPAAAGGVGAVAKHILKWAWKNTDEVMKANPSASTILKGLIETGYVLPAPYNSEGHRGYTERLKKYKRDGAAFYPNRSINALLAVPTIMTNDDALTEKEVDAVLANYGVLEALKSKDAEVRRKARQVISRREQAERKRKARAGRSSSRSSSEPPVHPRDRSNKPGEPKPRARGGTTIEYRPDGSSREHRPDGSTQERNPRETIEEFGPAD